MPLTRGDDTYRLSLSTVETDDGGYTWEIKINDKRGAAAREFKDTTDESYDTQDEAEEAGKARMTKLMKAK